MRTALGANCEETVEQEVVLAVAGPRSLRPSTTAAIHLHPQHLRRGLGAGHVLGERFHVPLDYQNIPML